MIDFINTQTDAEGNFRLVGMPKAMAHDDRVRIGSSWRRISTNPILEVKSTSPRPQGLNLSRSISSSSEGCGSPARNRQSDRKTRPAQVQYFPYASNPFVDKDEWRKLKTLKKGGPQGVTRPDGTYRLPGFAGRGDRRATTFTLGYRRGVGASEIPGMAKDGSFPTLGNPMPATTRGAWRLKEINLAPEVESLSCDLAPTPAGRCG